MYVTLGPLWLATLDWSSGSEENRPWLLWLAALSAGLLIAWPTHQLIAYQDSWILGGWTVTVALGAAVRQVRHELAHLRLGWLLVLGLNWGWVLVDPELTALNGLTRLMAFAAMVGSRKNLGGGFADAFAVSATGLFLLFGLQFGEAIAYGAMTSSLLTVMSWVGTDATIWIEVIDGVFDSIEWFFGLVWGTCVVWCALRGAIDNQDLSSRIDYLWIQGALLRPSTWSH